jgi:DNA topoisomerase-3
MKTAILCEKPSQAREIAAIVGATQKEDGFLHGNGYMVTWAFGHLIQLAMPDEYGFAGFVRENLPIIPEVFKLVPRQVKNGKCLNHDLLDYKILRIKEFT